MTSRSGDSIYRQVRSGWSPRTVGTLPGPPAPDSAAPSSPGPVNRQILSPLPRSSPTTSSPSPAPSSPPNTSPTHEDRDGVSRPGLSCRLAVSPSDLQLKSHPHDRPVVSLRDQRRVLGQDAAIVLRRRRRPRPQPLGNLV